MGDRYCVHPTPAPVRVTVPEPRVVYVGPEPDIIGGGIVAAALIVGLVLGRRIL